MSSVHFQKLLKPADAAAFLDVSRSTLAKRRMTGNGPRFVKFGASVRYSLQDLEEYVTQSERHSTSDQGGGTR
jgi:predicted DNA-binding transcriptional regulator AlpA